MSSKTLFSLILLNPANRNIFVEFASILRRKPAGLLITGSFLYYIDISYRDGSVFILVRVYASRTGLLPFIICFFTDLYHFNMVRIHLSKPLNDGDKVIVCVIEGLPMLSFSRTGTKMRQKGYADSMLLFHTFILFNAQN